MKDEYRPHYFPGKAAKALSNADLRERLIAADVTPIGNTPAEFAAVVNADLAETHTPATAGERGIRTANNSINTNSYE